MRIASSAFLMLILPGTILLLSATDSRFTPPIRAQQLAAIGPTTALPQSLQRALDPREDFQSIPEPEPSDWLANHAEAGQTFDQFTRSMPNRPDNHRNKLYLQPLGRFSDSDAPSLDQLRRFTAAFFMMEVVVLPPSDWAQNRITSRQNPWTGQRQLLTGDILNALQARLPKDAFALLGITWSIGFDVVERYRGLLNFHREAGFEDEAQWLEKRLRFIAPHSWH